jgi:hypothetical protein
MLRKASVFMDNLVQFGTGMSQKTQDSQTVVQSDDDSPLFGQFFAVLQRLARRAYAQIPSVDIHHHGQRGLPFAGVHTFR